MNPLTRKALFYSFLVIFLTVGGYLILTAQGWIIDWKELKILKTGAILLKFSPEDATLTVNGEKVKYSRIGFIQSNGTLIKNLAPDDYLLKLTKEGYEEWSKNLTVKSGLITSASQIKLWPKEVIKESLIKKIKDFWLTAGGIVYKNSNNQIVFNDFILRGTDVFLTKPDSKLLITVGEDENYFLINLEDPLSAVNLNHLFNSLKQRQLNLPGIVPIKNIFFHPFSPSKLVITSNTSFYTLDLNKIQIEKLITAQKLKFVSLSNNEAFILDENDNLIIVNLLLKTSSKERIGLESIKKIKTNSLGTKVFFLTSKNALKLYNRSLKTVENLMESVKDFYLDSEEKRVAIITSDDKLKILYFEEYKGDIKYEAGTIINVPIKEGGEFKKITWLPNFINYLVALKNGELIIQEIDKREPLNSYSIWSGVLNYDLDGKNLYFLTEGGDFNAYAIFP